MKNRYYREMKQCKTITKYIFFIHKKLNIKAKRNPQQSAKQRAEEGEVVTDHNSNALFTI
jgi:hypothetical protein